MPILNILRILGLLLILYSLTFIPPILVALWYHESSLWVFVYSLLAILLFGSFIWFPVRRSHREIRAREGFLIVTLIWCFLSLASTLPFLLSEKLHLSFADAIFESISGLTTTGATVITGLDHLPHSLLYYRQQLQLIGGGGIILFGIAILPMLGVGGMQLFRAEMSGPFKEDKMTPRIAETAKTLWLIYLGLVVVCAFAYWVFGMNIFDALTHSFATVSTGGFSCHDQNLGYFKNDAILWVSIIFMIIGAINFSLHFLTLRSKSLKHYWRDPECRTFLYFILLITLVVGTSLISYDVIKNPDKAFLESLFQVTSFCTTTGFFNSNFSAWPTFIPILLLLICLIGGSSGSTAGGIKMIRAIILYKQWFREMERLIHPNGHYVIKLGLSRLQPRTLDAIWGFFGMFVGIFGVLLVLLLATGLDLITSFSGLVAALTSTGLGLGSIADHFQSLNDSAKLILSFAMLLGRLEFFTMLILLLPSYWRS